MTDPKHRITKTIATHPGIHFNHLVRALNIAPGQAQYHLRDLLQTDTIVEERLYGRTHYFPPGYDPFERGAIAVLHRETARDILFFLLEEEESKPTAVADALGIARSTLEWHLNHLTEQGLVEKRHDDHNRVTLVLPNPEETLRLLTDIEPALPDRLVDRFTRLIDQFLAD